MNMQQAILAALLQGGDSGPSVRPPVYPRLAAAVDPYLSWRERQANESRLADFLLPKALPEYLQGMAYGTLPKEPPLTSWNSTATYVPAALEVAAAVPAVRTLGDALLKVSRKGMTEAVDSAARAVSQGRRMVPAGQFNIGAGPSGKAATEALDQADPAIRAMVTNDLKARGLRDVQITDGVIRDEIARRNAVTMMGLPEGNTAADRAKVMGFDTPAYHGTVHDVKEFDPSSRGKTTAAMSSRRGFFFASNPNVASTYANALNPDTIDSGRELGKILAARQKYDSAEWQHIKNNLSKSTLKKYFSYEDAPLSGRVSSKINKLKDDYRTANNGQWSYVSDDAINAARQKVSDEINSDKYTQKVMPVILKQENPLVHDFGGNRYRDESYASLINSAHKEGNSGVVLKNTYDSNSPLMGEMTDVYVATDPSHIRSRFAAFDPARAKEADILAGVGAATVTPTALMLADMLRMKDRSGL